MIKSLTMSGVFVRKKENIKYDIEFKKTQGKEIYNFSLDGDLKCSVLRTFKPGGAVDTECWGDFSVFNNFIAATVKFKFKKTKQEILAEELTEHGLYRKIKQQDSEFTRVQGLLDTEIIEDRIETEDFETDLRYIEINPKVKVAKISGLEYKNKVDASKHSNVRIANIRDLNAIRMVKDLSWLDKKDYKIVDSIEDFDILVKTLKELVKQKVPIAIDTETTGVSINRLPMSHPKRDNLVGICISWKEDTGYYVPIRQRLFNNLDEKYVIEEMREILTKGHIVTHYGTFDWKVFWTYGIDLNIVDDTYILQYLVDVRQAKSVKKLKVMAKNILGIDQLDLEDFFPSRGRRKQKISFDLLPYDAVKAYGPADTDSTLALRNILRPKLLPQMQFIYGVEIKLLKKIAYTEYMGLKIDLEKLKKFEIKLKAEREKLKKEIFELAGEEFAVNSVKELRNILYNKMKMPILAWTKGSKKNPVKQPSTGKQALNLLSKIKDKDGKPIYPLAGKLLEYRATDKLITAFINKLFEDNIDGWIFPKYNQAGAESGRIAGYEPNLQQAAGSIRELFIPPEGYYIIDFDYSQIEYRVMAALAKEYGVIELFDDPDSDFHTMMASRMFGVPLNKVDSKMRKDGKTLNFGVSFGMGDYTLAQELFGNTSDESIRKAAEKRAQYFESIPNIRDMFIETKDLAQLQEYIDTYFHRRRYFTNINSTDIGIREAERRKAGNTRIQGTAADILKIAYVRAANFIEKNKLDAYIGGSIHDELLFMVHKSINPWWFISHMRKCLELNITGFPKLYTGAVVCNTWADGDRDECEIPIRLSDQRMKEVERGLHTEPINDPFEYVKMDIKNYAIKELYSYIIEELGITPSARGINMSWLDGKLDNLKIMNIIKKYFDGNLKLALEQTFGKVYTDSDEILVSTEKLVIIDDTDDSEDFKEAMEEIDTIIDDEIDGFDDEEEIIDSRIVARLNNIGKSAEELEIKGGAKVISAVNEFMRDTDNCVIFHNRKCMIKLDGISKDSLNELMAYLKSNSKPSGYEVHLEMLGKIVKPGLFVYSVDRDIINDLVLGRKTGIRPEHKKLTS